MLLSVISRLSSRMDAKGNPLFSADFSDASIRRANARGEKGWSVYNFSRKRDALRYSSGTFPFFRYAHLYSFPNLKNAVTVSLLQKRESKLAVKYPFSTISDLSCFNFEAAVNESRAVWLA